MLALVTGSSSGIGKSISIYLKELGYDLILVSRNVDDIKIESKKISCDLSKIDNVYKLYDQIKNEEIDLLVNCAGFGLIGNSWEIDTKKELEMINVNAISPCLLTKLVLKDMIKKDKGRILNVTSSAGFSIGPLFNSYYATKNYISKYTLGLYQELKSINSNVHVSILAPGPVNTNFNNKMNAKFKTKALNSKYVAKYAIDKCLKNKLLIVPGFTNKLAMLSNRICSYKTIMKVNYKIQKNKIIDEKFT